MAIVIDELVTEVVARPGTDAAGGEAQEPRAEPPAEMEEIRRGLERELRLAARLVAD